jgi:hypothetical protein
MRRRHFYLSTLFVIPWLYLEPLVTRIIADAHGINRARR